MISRRALSLLLIAVLGISVAPANASMWTPPILPLDTDLVGWQIVDSYNHEGGASWLKQNTRDGNPERQREAEWRLCTELGKAPCSRADGAFDANIVLPHCSSATQEWCVEGISIARAKDKPVKGKFIRNVDGPKTSGVLGLKIPQGSTAGLWSVPGAEHRGGVDTYATLVNLRFVGGGNSKEASVAYMDARVIPYREIEGRSAKSLGQYEPHSLSEFYDQEQDLWLAGVSGGHQECAWTEVAKCGLIEEFPREVKVSMTLRIGKRVTGWLMGRLSDPVVQISQFSADQNRLTIDASPVAVPIFYATAKKSELSDSMKKTFMTDNFVVDNPKGIWMQKGNAFQSYDVLLAWKNAAKDSSVALYSIWSFATTSSGSGSKCLENKDQLMGLVTTNATAYEGSAPNFVKDTLDYKVASMHLNPDGSVFEGKYDLIMLKSVAQCLYGFKDAPISASITVLNNGKEEKIATNSFYELESAGKKWLKLSAQGFTFSNPTLKVKLSQKDSSYVARRVTITCVRGKTTKKLSGVNPKCPAGFKKK